MITDTYSIEAELQSLSIDDASTIQKLNDFREKRETRKRMHFTNVLLIGLFFVIVGTISAGSIYVLNLPTHWSVPSFSIHSVGLIIFFTIPPSILDYGDDENFGLCYRCFIFLFCMPNLLAPSRACNILVPVLFIVALSILLRSRYNWDVISIKLYIAVDLILLQKALSYFYYGIFSILHPSSEVFYLVPIGVKSPLYYIHSLLCGCISLLITCALLHFQVVNTIRYRDSNGFKGKCPTTIVQASVFAFIAACSIFFFLNGECYITEYNDVERGSGYLTLSLIDAILAFCYFYFGEEIIRCFLERRVYRPIFEMFDKDFKNLVEDGAFISELLDTVEIEEFGIVWLHYDKCDMPQRDGFDNHLRYWYEVEVIDREGEKIAVRFLDNELADKDIMWIDHSLIVPSNGSSSLGEALTHLRCVDWDKFTVELFATSIRDGSVSSNYDVSRQVKPGERIDFFISHSWRDDGELKYQRLCEVAEEFKMLNGRYPTFWFDKVCIDQKNIIEGLRVLPINIMACQKMLVLWGSTYLERLWCIWELFTLNCFLDTALAAQRIKLCSLSTSELGDTEAIRQLNGFDVTNAHCYDPNEENKLLAVIDANGRSTFNKRVRDIAEELAKRRFDSSHFWPSVKFDNNEEMKV